MSSSTAFLHLLSLCFLSKTPSPSSLDIFPSSISPLPKLFPIPTSSRLFEAAPSSRFVRNVAVSSPFELDEEFQSDGHKQQRRNYSRDLTVYVGNLPFKIDSAALGRLFERAGNVEMVKVIYDKVSGNSRGYGFVTMSSIKEVEAATRQFDGYELYGRQLRVNSWPPLSKGQSPFKGTGDGGGGGSFDKINRVYVGNLAWSVDNLALASLFQKHGNVMDARVVYNRDTGRSKGFGFVTYSSGDEVNNAIDSLDGVNVDGKNIRVSVAETRKRRQF